MATAKEIAVFVAFPSGFTPAYFRTLSRDGYVTKLQEARLSGLLYRMTYGDRSYTRQSLCLVLTRMLRCNSQPAFGWSHVKRSCQFLRESWKRLSQFHGGQLAAHRTQPQAILIEDHAPHRPLHTFRKARADSLCRSTTGSKLLLHPDPIATEL